MSASEEEWERLVQRQMASAILLHGSIAVLHGLNEEIDRAGSHVEQLSVGVLILSALGDLKRAADESERAIAAVLAHKMRQAGMTEVRTETHVAVLADPAPLAKPRPFSNDARSPLTLSRTVH